MIAIFIDQMILVTGKFVPHSSDNVVQSRLGDIRVTHQYAFSAKVKEQNK
jgi:hypothetical protein